MNANTAAFAQLLRLRGLRVQAAERVLRERQAERAAALQAAAERERRIESHRRQIDELAVATVDDCAARVGRWAPCISAWREKLDDLLERDEYGLIDDQDHLAEVDERCAQARRLWQREQAREGVARELLQQARKGRLRAEQAAADLEFEERRPSGGETRRGVPA